MFEFIADLGILGIFLLFLLFIFFVFAVKKILGIIKNVIIIVIASVLFPVVLNMVFGFDIPLDVDTILSFVFIGIAAYIVYGIARAVYFFIKVAEKAGKAITSPIREMKKRHDAELKEKMKEHIKREEHLEKTKSETERLEKKMLEDMEEKTRKQGEALEQEKKRLLEELKRQKPKKEYYKDYVKISDKKQEQLIKDIREVEDELKKVNVRKDSEKENTFIEPLPEINPKRKKRK